MGGIASAISSIYRTFSRRGAASSSPGISTGGDNSGGTDSGDYDPSIDAGGEADETGSGGLAGGTTTMGDDATSSGPGAGGVLAGVGGAIGGALLAFKGFKKGRCGWHDLQGISGVAASVAAVSSMFGPVGLAVSAVAGAVSVVTGLVGGLLGKGPADRNTNESKSVMAQSYVQGALHNYQFGNDSAMGADYSVGGVARQGGAISTNHYYIQAMDARSFQQFLGNNPTALGGGMEAAFSNSGLQALAQVQGYAATLGGF